MSNNTLTKKDLKRCLWRYIFTRQAPFNYETMQSGGWVYSLHPALSKIYDNDPEVLKEKYNEHFKFYNTQPWMGNLILGACIAIESTKSDDCTRQAVETRTALMGPLAGLGDAIIFVMFMTITGAIAAYMALEGSVVGWVIAEVINLLIWGTFNKLFYVAYDKGVEFVTERSSQMKHLTEAASVVGLAVVGALIASTVNVSLGLTFSVGEVTQSVNDLLNSIVPHFANVVTVGLIYWGLGKKNMNSAKMIVIVLIVSIALSAFGILA